MNDWLARLREWGKIVLFWNKGKDHSQEFRSAPHDDHALVLSVQKKSLPSPWQQIRFLRRVFSKKEWRLFLGGFALFFITLTLGAVGLLDPHIQSVPAHGGTFTEAVIGSPKLINPLYASLNDVDRDLTALVYSGLFRFDERLSPVLDLAQTATWSNDQKTLDIVLKKNVLFHDGTPLTADDVVFTFEAVQDPAWRSPLASQYRGVKTVRVDDQTVQFQFEKPTPDAFALLTLGILPANIWEDAGNGNAMLAEANVKPIGTGPYKAASITRDAKGMILTYNLKQFGNYYGTKPFIGDWRFQFFSDRSQAIVALRNHQVDALAFVPWGDMQEFKNSTIKTYPLELPQETVAFFNVKDAALKDIRLRKALTLAIDPQELMDVTPSTHIVTSPFPFATTTPTPPDLDGARALLTSMNWILKDGATVRTLAQKTDPKNKTPATAASSTELVLTISVPNQPDLMKVADYLKRRWSLLGARVEIQTEEPDVLLHSALTERSYQILIWNVLLSPTQDLSPFWDSKNTAARGLNLSNLADKTIDTALDSVAAATNTAALETAQTKLADAIKAQYPALFLLRPAYAYLISDRVHGVTESHISRPSDRFTQSSAWYIRTTWAWKK
ncbi:MAG: ABC transporter substrate-binding protein [bacterium]|nr:ABC transporter substrate-binding protein [bacterium]